MMAAEAMVAAVIDGCPDLGVVELDFLIALCFELMLVVV
jgi:hypothetical protein